MKDSKVKPIMLEIEYGAIRSKLNEYLNKRGITTYELSDKAHIRFQTITNLRHNSATRIDFEVLAKMCYALNCKIEDIIEYRPNESSKGK